MSTDFNIRREIRSIIDGTDLASPAEIAAKVAENIPDNLLREVVAQLLPELVRVELTRVRMVTPPNQSARSAKVTAIRRAAEGWRRALRDRIHVGRGEWRLLADCSAEHLRFAAQERQQQAAQSLAAADRYAAIADACEQHKVTRTADLPEPVLAALLDGGAVAA